MRPERSQILMRAIESRWGSSWTALSTSAIAVALPRSRPSERAGSIEPSAVIRVWSFASRIASASPARRTSQTASTLIRIMATRALAKYLTTASSTGSSPVACLRRSFTVGVCLRLAPFEPRLALLEERGDAFAEVVGLGRGRLQLRFELELLLERRVLGVVEEALREGDAARRKRRKLGGP